MIPKTMKAVCFHKYGSPEELVIEEFPVPEPGDDEVLVKMLASDSQIPCFIGFLFMKRQPSGNNFQLLARQRTRQQLAIDCDCCFIFLICEAR